MEIALKVIGIMWNLNDGDILDEIIQNALSKVDELLVVDDGSIDNSWDIISNYKSRLAYCCKFGDKGSNPKNYQKGLWHRQHAMDRAKEIFGRDVWIQVIEGDMMIMDTNVRSLVNESKAAALNWIMCSACNRDWPEEIDNLYPNWGKSIREIMPDGYVDEVYPATFRPLDGVQFTYKNNKRSQWPSGLDLHGFQYCNPYTFKRPKNNPHINSNSPLLAHYGYRGTKMYREKIARLGIDYAKRGIDITYRESMLNTAREFTYPKRYKYTFMSPLARESLRGQFFGETE